MTIDLGPDFPLSADALARRELIEKYLINALYGIRHDPIAGNVAHNVSAAARAMGFEMVPCDEGESS